MYTDFCEAYEKVIPAKRHRAVGKRMRERSTDGVSARDDESHKGTRTK